MNLLMFSARVKLMRSHLIALKISKLIWRKVLHLLTECTPPPNRMYSLSQSELDTLHTFIEEHVNIGFIRPSKSPHGALVLFIKKKDGSLWLCVDYRRLNRITKKDHYPLPLLTDLLDAPKKAHAFTKIDLRHAYHLVRIADGEEWKLLSALVMVHLNGW